MHYRKPRRYSKEGHQKKLFRARKQDKGMQKILRGLLPPDARLKPQKSRPDRRKEEILSTQEFSALQALLDDCGYKLHAERISYGIMKLYHEDNSIFFPCYIDGETRLVFTFTNPNGKKGGLVEIGCHLHDDSGKNIVGPGSTVLAGAVLDGAWILGQSKVHGGKIKSSRIVSSNIYGLSAISNCRKIYKCVIANSPVSLCTLENMWVSETPLIGKIFRDKVLIRGRESNEAEWRLLYHHSFKYVMPMVELEKAAWEWKENLAEDGTPKGGNVPFVRSLI